MLTSLAAGKHENEGQITFKNAALHCFQKGILVNSLFGETADLL